MFFSGSKLPAYITLNEKSIPIFETRFFLIEKSEFTKELNEFFFGHEPTGAFQVRSLIIYICYC